jgi:hypothetical protein
MLIPLMYWQNWRRKHEQYNKHPQLYFSFSTPFGYITLRRGSFCHLQMAMKYCNEIQVSLISHKGGEVSISYFILCTPVGSTIIQRKVIESSSPKCMHMYK